LLHITETKEGEEPNITYKYAGQTIKVRAIAVDNDTENGQLVSAPSAVINISVNNDIPLFSNLKVKQINASNTVLSEDDYTDGKFLTGENWYIRQGAPFTFANLCLLMRCTKRRSVDSAVCYNYTSYIISPVGAFFNRVSQNRHITLKRGKYFEKTLSRYFQA
jgi:hypothetical protein